MYKYLTPSITRSLSFSLYTVWRLNIIDSLLVSVKFNVSWPSFLQNAEFDDLTMEVTNLREISETAFTEIKKNELQFTTSVKKLKTTEIQLLVISNSVF